MIHATEVTYANVLTAAAQTGDTLTSAIDTAGANYITLIASFGAIAASGDLTAFKLTESETSGGTYTDVASGAVTNASIGTASLPAADDDNKIYVWHVEVAKLTKRFLKLSAACHASNSAVLGVNAITSRLAESPALTTAGTGAEAIVTI